MLENSIFDFKMKFAHNIFMNCVEKAKTFLKAPSMVIKVITHQLVHDEFMSKYLGDLLRGCDF